MSRYNAKSLLARGTLIGTSVTALTGNRNAVVRRSAGSRLVKAVGRRCCCRTFRDRLARAFAVGTPEFVDLVRVRVRSRRVGKLGKKLAFQVHVVLVSRLRQLTGGGCPYGHEVGRRRQVGRPAAAHGDNN